ncbi:MAG: chorismate mutase [Coxiellaceae bacterium]|nr:chorismate mutase [Coxiellaceae bacterium]
MSLSNLRKEIDKIDYQIHDLLNQRAKIALEVGKKKIEEDGENVEFFRPEREKAILEAVSEYNQGPLSNEAVAHIFRVILQECCELQINTYQKSE